MLIRRSSRWRKRAASTAAASEGTVEDLAWLEEQSSTSHACVGYDASGWTESVWILHAMYEAPSVDGRTHDEARREQLRRGEAEPLIVNGVDLDDVTRATGVPLGMSWNPGRGWTRLLWRELAVRLHLDLSAQQGPPSDGWFRYRSWPASIQPPCEGSLDRESLLAMVDVLSAFSPSGGATRCHFFHAPTTWWPSAPPAHVIDVLGRVPMFGRIGDEQFTPSNIWPEDRSWVVYTDWDLNATKVSGSSALISALHNEPSLETLCWP